jgi:GH25 family lysozyme M1 (1,4-beta-N-acetylmuramidase)
MKYLLVAVLLIVPSLSVLGVDVSQLFSTSTYQCMKNSGYHFVVPRAYHSYGGVDTNAVQNLQNAKAAGLVTDVYLFPCKSKSASAQVDQMVAAVASNLYGMIWLDIETNTSPGCGWGTDYESSCKFVEELISRIKYHGKVPGIYASSYMWQSIMGGVSKCPSVASAPLWYAHYDKSPSFSDFKPFGGWTKPHVKQFEGTSSLCGASVDKNYYP